MARCERKDLLAVYRCDVVGHHKQAAIWFARKGLDGEVDLGSVLDLRRNRLER